MTNPPSPPLLPEEAERVARALCAVCIGPLENGSWALMSEDGRESFRNEARAAIAAMHPEREALIEALEYVKEHLLADPCPLARKHVRRVVDKALSHKGAKA